MKELRVGSFIFDADHEQTGVVEELKDGLVRYSCRTYGDTRRHFAWTPEPAVTVLLETFPEEDKSTPYERMVRDLVSTPDGRFGETPDGDLYWTDPRDGQIYNFRLSLELVTYGVVYAIYDIRYPEEMRYIGATTRGARKRLQGHRSAAGAAQKYWTDKPLYRWIREVGRDNLGVRELQVVSKPGDLWDAEKAWIEYFSQRETHPLFNRQHMPEHLVLNDDDPGQKAEQE